jgi:acyl carrier protein
MDASLQDRLRQLVSSQLGVDLDELVTDARILDDLGADSLDVVELVMAIEEAFDIVVPDEDVEGMQTVGDVESYLVRRISD